MASTDERWRSVHQARRHGYNVRKAPEGWQLGRLTADGYQYAPQYFMSREVALVHAYWRCWYATRGTMRAA